MWCIINALILLLITYLLTEKGVRYDVRKYHFTERIVNMWNSLPDVVVNSSTINQFKNKLDKHWSKQEMMYACKAELAGISSKSNTYYSFYSST